MLKEYWDNVAHSREQLTQNKGVESISVSNKINKEAIINENEPRVWEFKIVYHLRRDVQS